MRELQDQEKESAFLARVQSHPTVVFMLTLLLLTMITTPIFAMKATKVAAALPPRPTVEPVIESAKPGAYIQLQASGVTVGTDGVWTMLQWGDGANNWYDVSGWQGTIEPDGTRTWWVAPGDMGTGPFRWLVLTEEGGSVLATSESFDLPELDRHVLIMPLEVE